MADFKIWGEEHIDEASKAQMQNACDLPVAVAGALMPDAHLGYGLPIGGVLALENAVCPYAVGVDIACRMKLSVFEIDPEELGDVERFSRILSQQTFFGVGVENQRRRSHDVMLADDWQRFPIARDNADKARRQLGTSGSGNHFVEWGVASVPDRTISVLGKEVKFEFVALLSHSGSRGAGAAVCAYYSKLAKSLRPEYGDLAYLDLDSPEGQAYWDEMSLMGAYAAANHDCIHDAIADAVGVKPIYQVENHHNFAWKEVHDGREVVVHRKGATPAGVGVRGIIPGSMGTPAYIVQGKGNPESLCSASHGAGRVMSRKQAKKVFDYKAEIEKLSERGITVLSAGADEVCGVYKNIDDVMAAQEDLVSVVAKFDPKIVKMCGSGDRAED